MSRKQIKTHHCGGSMTSGTLKPLVLAAKPTAAAHALCMPCKKEDSLLLHIAYDLVQAQIVKGHQHRVSFDFLVVREGRHGQARLPREADVNVDLCRPC